MKSKCCHPKSDFLCKHPCRACRANEARTIAADIRALERDAKASNHTDTELSWQLINRTRKLLAKIGREA